jgi:nucleoid-associated protein YgaU|tara:strand:- start:3263 stop:3547 length:285 start_codon:yes stop_codon:yes gene_type:complete
MSRYEKTNTRRVRKSKVVGEKSKLFLKYDTTIYEEVQESNNDLFVIATEGDRLDNLANQYYGDPSLWWFIAQTNNISTMNVPAGTSLRISFNIQ